MKLKIIIQYIIDFPFWIVSDIKLNPKSIPTLIILIFTIWYLHENKMIHPFFSF